MKDQGVACEEPEDGAGEVYATMLRELAASDAPAFVCHFYNVYFAHTAGGQMIGKKVWDMLLDGRTLDFYQWEGDLPEMMAAVKADINTLAEGWTEEQRQHCLDETMKSFQYSGALLQYIAGAH